MIKKISARAIKNIPSTGIYSSIIMSLPIHKEDLFDPFTETQSNKKTGNKINELINKANNLLHEPGIMFIYGSPIQLIKTYEVLPRNLRFRYWIALDFFGLNKGNDETKLRHNHLGILMLIKGDKIPHIDTKNTRVPYWACTACGRNIRDWGGKKHLMNVKGIGISDIWKDYFEKKYSKKDPNREDITLHFIDISKNSFKFNEQKIPEPVLERISSLVESKKNKVLYLQFTKEFIEPINKSVIDINRPIQFSNTKSLENKVILGDSLKIMRSWLTDYPDGLFDLVFADPPYNLNKNYDVYNDTLADKKYIDWCNKWLELVVKLTKPTGSIFILNLPKWALEHAITLNKYVYLQNWIVWDALSTPKGKIMPAHYSLLYYTKSPNSFTFKSNNFIDSPEYCLRTSCLKQRKEMINGFSEFRPIEKQNNQVPVSDIWRDIPRIKHKKDRDNHPCHLPIGLMDRIVKLFSREGDLVFDPFAGAGTTAIAAIKNNRKYLTIEIDPNYKKLTEKKLNEVKNNGKLERKKISKSVNSNMYTKRWLEIKVQEFAQEIGRRPQLDEFISKYSLNLFEIEKLYVNPKTVLKASRISLMNQAV